MVLSHITDAPLFRAGEKRNIVPFPPIQTALCVHSTTSKTTYVEEPWWAPLYAKRGCAAKYRHDRQTPHIQAKENNKNTPK